MTAPRKPWSIEEDRLLVRLRCEGIDRDLISEAMGRDRNAVSCRSQRLQKIGVVGTIARDARYWRLLDGGMEKLEAWHARNIRGGRRTWDRQQRNEVADMYQDGLGYRAIAHRVGAPPSSVRKILAALRQEGEIGYERRPWSDEELDELVALYRAGQGDAQIAVKLKRSAEAVIQKRRDMKLRRATGEATAWV